MDSLTVWAEFLVQELQERVRELEDERDSLRHSVNMFKQKLTKVGERQIENERKLKVCCSLVEVTCAVVSFQPSDCLPFVLRCCSFIRV